MSADRLEFGDHGEQFDDLDVEEDGVEEAVASEEQCVWMEEVNEGEVWETACGEAHQFMVGGPRENNHRFCPYCGRPLLERKQ